MGPLAGGTQITITGTGFRFIEVFIDTAAARVLTIEPSSRITVVTPPSSAGVKEVVVIIEIPHTLAQSILSRGGP